LTLNHTLLPMQKLKIRCVQLCVCCIVLLIAQSAILIAQTYNLKLGRSIKIQDSYLLRGSAQRSTRLIVPRTNGTKQIIPQASSMIQLQANCKVVAVTVDGQEAMKTVTIRSANMVRESENSDLLPTGFDFTATFSDEGPKFEHDGKPLADSIVQELALVVRGEGGSKIGLIMNPSKPVAVGDTWPMNKAAFIKSLDADTRRNIKKVKGTVTFERIDTIRGTPAAVIVLEATATNVIPINKHVKVVSSTFQSRIEVTVPLDERYPELHTHSASVWSATLEPPEKNSSTVVMEFEHSDDISFYR